MKSCNAVREMDMEFNMFVSEDRLYLTHSMQEEEPVSRRNEESIEIIKNMRTS